MSAVKQNGLEPKALTIVVGAGASKEVHLPLGSELKLRIAQLLDIKYNFNKQAGGDYLIAQAFSLLSADNNENPGDINPLLNASWRIRDAMSQAISIDNFIDAHKGDVNIENAGKLAIVRSILEAEAKSSLTIKPENTHNKLDFKANQATWFNSFFQVVTENCTFDDLPYRLKQIGIICFNYDRCIEHYMFHALKNYYGVNDKDARDMLCILDIHHPYGSVGNLPWMESDLSIGFGEEPTGQQLVELAKRIKTFTEETAEDEISKIRQLMHKPKRVAFLGFAFHTLNLRLLYMRSGAKQNTVTSNEFCHVFATGIGISAHDVNALKIELTNMAQYDFHRIEISNGTHCAQLFNEFRRSLSFR